MAVRQGWPAANSGRSPWWPAAKPCRTFSGPFHHLFGTFSVGLDHHRNPDKIRASRKLTAKPGETHIWRTTQHHIPTEKAGVIIGQLADEYLSAQGGSPKTAVIRRQALAHLQRFLDAQGRERLADITAADLEAWRLDLLQRNFAPASLEVFCRSVRQFFHWLEQGQRLFVNPAAGFIVPKPPRPVLPVLTPEQIQRLLSQPDQATATGTRDRALLALVYATGITAQEVRSLHCQDASREAVKVRGRKPRTLPLDAPAAEALARYLDQARPALLAGNKTPALWLTNRGQALTHEALQQICPRH